MNHSVAASTLSSLESDSKNYKSLFEEIAQNDTTIYLNDSLSDDIIRYVDETTQCCCCKVHRRQSSFIAGAPVSKTFNIPMYNTIWIGEMKNATDYIEYLNETRRNSFNSLNKDNRSNYYKLMLSDEVNSSSKTKSRNDNFLQVPTLTANEHQRPLTPEFKDISMKIDQIHTLDQSTNQLIYKAIEVHADILSLDATVSRLLAETRKLLEDLEDVKGLDDIIDMLNAPTPIIHRHREWMNPITNLSKIPVDEGIIVS